MLLVSSLLAFDAVRSEAPSLLFSISTDQQTYIPSQPVLLTLSLTNPNDTDLTLSFRSSHQYDFLIERKDQEVWRWSDGRMFAQVLTQLVLAPHETRTFHATWDQKDRDGKQVPSDSYEVLGLLLAEDRTYTATTSMHILQPTPAGLTKQSQSLKIIKESPMNRVAIVSRRTLPYPPPEADEAEMGIVAERIQ